MAIAFSTFRTSYTSNLRCANTKALDFCGPPGELVHRFFQFLPPANEKQKKHKIRKSHTVLFACSSASSTDFPPKHRAAWRQKQRGGRLLTSARLCTRIIARVWKCFNICLHIESNSTELIEIDSKVENEAGGRVFISQDSFENAQTQSQVKCTFFVVVAVAFSSNGNFRCKYCWTFEGSDWKAFERKQIFLLSLIFFPNLTFFGSNISRKSYSLFQYFNRQAHEKIFKFRFSRGFLSSFAWSGKKWCQHVTWTERENALR